MLNIFPSQPTLILLPVILNWWWDCIDFRLEMDDSVIRLALRATWWKNERSYAAPKCLRFRYSKKTVRQLKTCSWNRTRIQHPYFHALVPGKHTVSRTGAQNAMLTEHYQVEIWEGRLPCVSRPKIKVKLTDIRYPMSTRWRLFGMSG